MIVRYSLETIRRESWLYRQCLLCLPARYWRRSIQRYKLHRLSGGVPEGSQDGGNHSYWRNRRERRGECSRISQTAQLCKRITLSTPIHLLCSPFEICYDVSPPQVYQLAWIIHRFLNKLAVMSFQIYQLWRALETIISPVWHSLGLSLLAFYVEMMNLKSTVMISKPSLMQTCVEEPTSRTAQNL